MKIATFIKSQISGSGADQKVYAVDPPMQTYKGADVNHVCVSAVYVMYSGPETYIFPCDAEGNITDFGELEGSYRGELDHEQALTNAGYEIR